MPRKAKPAIQSSCTTLKSIWTKYWFSPYSLPLISLGMTSAEGIDDIIMWDLMKYEKNSKDDLELFHLREKMSCTLRRSFPGSDKSASNHDFKLELQQQWDWDYKGDH